MRVFLDLLLFLCAASAYISCFKTEEGWSRETGLGALRYFTVLSNLLCAFAALAAALALLGGELPRWIWLWKYVGTAAVTVTLVTVLVFLGPNLGYKLLLTGRDLFLHLICPLLAIASFCFCERVYPLPFPLALTGLAPVILYGTLYLYKVVLCPEEKRWEDFYGYNKSGKWQLSFAAMVVGGALICALLWLLYRI